MQLASKVRMDLSNRRNNPRPRGRKTRNSGMFELCVLSTRSRPIASISTLGFGSTASFEPCRYVGFAPNTTRTNASNGPLWARNGHVGREIDSRELLATDGAPSDAGGYYSTTVDWAKAAGFTVPARWSFLPA
jgi:hypothetical protein